MLRPSGGANSKRYVWKTVFDDRRHKHGPRHEVATVYLPGGGGLSLYEVFGSNGASLRLLGGPHAPGNAYLILGDESRRYNVLHIRLHPQRPNIAIVTDTRATEKTGSPQVFELDTRDHRGLLLEPKGHLPEYFPEGLAEQRIAGVILTHDELWSDKDLAAYNVRFEQKGQISRFVDRADAAAGFTRNRTIVDRVS